MNQPARYSNDSVGAAPPRRRRPLWRSLLLGLVLFFSGAVLGGAIALVGVRHALLQAVHHPEESPAKIAAKMRRSLALSDRQTAEVLTILRRHQRAFQQLRAEVQPRVMAELDEIEIEVAAVLDFRQREAWHRRFATLRETWLPPLAGAVPSPADPEPPSK